jgi:ubiquinone/menaquinone biosynthesis C-methylase UbiE
MLRKLDALLDASPLSRSWQLLKWKVKYHLRGRGSVQPFEELITWPHRTYLCEAIARLQPRAIFDLGCGKGPNLYLLHKRLPDAALTGTDPSAEAIAQARDNLSARGVPAALSVESADDMWRFADGSFDAVLCDSVLFYIPPADIRRVLAEIVRVARTGAIISTWHFDAKGGEPARYDDSTWIYDYRALMAGIPDIDIEIAPFPDDAWTDPRWRTYGAIITARHRRNLQ